jgi:hypothetical protein
MCLRGRGGRRRIIIKAPAEPAFASAGRRSGLTRRSCRSSSGRSGGGGYIFTTKPARLQKLAMSAGKINQETYSLTSACTCRSSQ